MIATTIMAVYLAALIVIFVGQYRGWFDPNRVAAVLSASEIKLVSGATITFSGAPPGMFVRGDRVKFSSSKRAGLGDIRGAEYPRQTAEPRSLDDDRQ